jgi:hypothetical protein
MKPSMQKPLMALSQRPRQVDGSHPMTSRHRRTTWPCSSMLNSHDQNGLPVQPEVVSVLEVLREHDVASVEEGRELGDGEVPYPPGILVLVGDASVEDEAPPRSGSLVHGPEWLNEEGQGAALRDHFHHALPGPCGEFGTQRNLGSFVALPTGVVRPPRVSKGKPGLGHDHAALRHRGRNRVEGAETPVPVRRGHVDRNDVPTRKLLETDVVRQEAARRSRSDEAHPGRRRRGGPGQDGVRGAYGNHRRAAEEEGQRVRVRRGPEWQAGVREAPAGGDGRDAENPPVGEEMTEREVRQRV